MKKQVLDFEMQLRAAEGDKQKLREDKASLMSRTDDERACM